MKAYQPKRSTFKWVEGAPDYVLACYDNGGRTADRYTVYLGGHLWSPELGRLVQFLAMSDSPTHPQGFSQWGEVHAGCRPPGRDKVRWLDLPEHIRQHVINRATD